MDLARMGDLQQASPIPANIPKGLVTEWTVDDVRNWLSTSMQLPQYLEQFEENEIAGDVLVHLDHDALKDLDVTSVGHRLYLLKQIYNLKIAHGIKFEKDDYVPISAPKGDDEDAPAPEHFLKHLRDRDSKINVLENELKRVNDQISRLKDDLVPVFKMARDKPLPTPEYPTQMLTAPPLSSTTPTNLTTPTSATTGSTSSLARKFSTKKLFLGGGSRKTPDTDRQMEISKPLMSPTYLNGLAEERSRPESPRSPTKTSIPITPGLNAPTTPYYTPSPDPSSTSAASSVSYGQYTPTASWSTTSPVTPRRSERTSEDIDPLSQPRNRSNSATETQSDPPMQPQQTSSTTTTTTSTNTSSSSRPRPSRERNKDVSNPMKSFRVNLEDPCWKVLPAAMKKYDVRGREEDYRLYITYGDVGSSPPAINPNLHAERKLNSNDKPLIIFQQLQKEGRNPLFMLRYAGSKGRSGGGEERDSEREYRNGNAGSGGGGRGGQKQELQVGNKDEDPTTPKTATSGEAYARYG